MSNKFKRYLRILPLSFVPQGGNSILDWRPFQDGDTLGEIIEKHNTRCYESYRKYNWLEDFIKELGEGIEVLLHDLTSLDQLELKEFAKIDMILIDIKAIGKKLESVRKTKHRMATHVKSYHLPQISEDPDAKSCLQDFAPLAIVPSYPEILSNQKSFEIYLQKFCNFYREALNSIPPAPSTRGGGKELTRVFNSYIDSIPDIASEVRDAAIKNNFTSRQQVQILAQRAGAFEFTLGKLAEQIRDKTKPHVILDSIRETIDEISVKPGTIKTRFKGVDLLQVSIKSTLNELSPNVRIKLETLGLKQKNASVVHFNQKQIWDKLEGLENHLSIKEFSADLPSW